MTQFLSLSMALFKSRFKADGTKASKDYTWLIYLILGVIFVPLIVSLCIAVATFAPEYARQGAMTELVLLIYLILMIVVLIFSTVGMLTYVYFNRDAELLSSLPIANWKIFLAKIFVVYCGEFILAAATIIPLSLTLAITLTLSPLFYLQMLLALVLVPMLPMLIGAIISIPLMYLVTFFRKRSALTAIVMSLLLAGVMALYLYFYLGFMGKGGFSQTPDDEIINTFISSMSAMKRVFYPVTALIQFGLMTPVFGLGAELSALVSLLICLASFAVITLATGGIANLVYHKSVMVQTESQGGTSARTAQYKQQSVLLSLLSKEWKTLIRETGFAFQCLGGVIMGTVVTLVLLFINSQTDYTALQGIEEVGDVDVQGIIDSLMPGVLVMLTFMMCAGMNVAAASSISREGKNFAVTKLIPVPYKYQVMAKHLLSLILAGSASLVCMIVGSVVLHIEWWQAILGCISAVLYSYAYSAFAVRFDLGSPTLNWTTPTQAVKNTRSTIIPTLLNMLISLVIGIIIIVLALLGSPVIMWPTLVVVCFGAASLSHWLLYKDVDKLFEQIES